MLKATTGRLCTSQRDIRIKPHNLKKIIKRAQCRIYLNRQRNRCQHRRGWIWRCHGRQEAEELHDESKRPTRWRRRRRRHMDGHGASERRPFPAGDPYFLPETRPVTRHFRLHGLGRRRKSSYYGSADCWSMNGSFGRSRGAEEHTRAFVLAGRAWDSTDI